MNDISDKNIDLLSDAAIEKKIGAFIKTKRKHLNKTQSEVAHAAQISRSTLSLLENGETGTVATLIQVMRVLGLLDLFAAFEQIEEVSPLALAKLQLRKKERVRKSKNIKERKSDW